MTFTGFVILASFITLAMLVILHRFAPKFYQTLMRDARIGAAKGLVWLSAFIQPKGD